MAFAGLALAFLSSCSLPPRGGVEQTSEPLISGDDTRQDLYEVESERFRAIALQGSLALIADSQLQVEQDGLVRFDAPALGDSYGLCPSERFVSQPALAGCSATLVDVDLLLTAAHCVDTWPCKDQLWARGFAIIDAERAPELHTRDFYSCRTVPARRYERHEDGLVLDYAFVQLDRPVSGGRPATLSDTCCPEVGTPLTVIGYPSGLPVKIDGLAPLLDERGAERDYFSLASDTFVGSSGSGVFDEQGLLLGTLVRGGNDYVLDEAARCRVARHVPPDGSVYPGEQATYVERSLNALCDSGWPSEALCGRPSACGDGICSRDEHDPRCAADCPEISVFPRSVDPTGGCSLNPEARPGGSIPLAALVLAWFAHRRAGSRVRSRPSRLHRRCGTCFENQGRLCSTTSEGAVRREISLLAFSEDGSLVSDAGTPSVLSDHPADERFPVGVAAGENSFGAAWIQDGELVVQRCAVVFH